MVDKEDNKEDSNKQSENPKINVFGLNIDSGLLFLTSIAIGLGAAGFTWYTNNQKQQPQLPQPQPQIQIQPTQEEQDQLYREYIQNELRRRNQIRQQQEQQPLPLTGNNNHNNVYVNPPNQQNYDNNIEVGALLDMGKTRNHLNPPNVNHHYALPEIPNENKAPMINMGIYRKRGDQQQEEGDESQQQNEEGYSNEELMSRVNNNSYY